MEEIGPLDGLRWSGGRELLQHRAVKLRHILSAAGRDPVRIRYGRLIAIQSTGVPDVVGNRMCPGDLTTTRELRGNEDVRAVTDRKHRFLCCVEFATQPMDVAIAANPVRRSAARNQESVKILGRAIGNQLFGADALSVVESALSPNALPGTLVNSDDRYDCAGFLEGAARLHQIDFFESVADERGDSFSVHSLHRNPSFAVPHARPLHGPSKRPAGLLDRRSQQVCHFDFRLTERV